MKRETVHWCIQRPAAVAVARAYGIPIGPSFAWVEGDGHDQFGRRCRVVLGSQVLPQGFAARDVPGVV